MIPKEMIIYQETLQARCKNYTYSRYCRNSTIILEILSINCLYQTVEINGNV